MKRHALTMGVLVMIGVWSRVTWAWTYDIVDDTKGQDVGADSQLVRYTLLGQVEGQRIAYTDTTAGAIKSASRVRGASRYTNNWVIETVKEGPGSSHPSVAVDVFGTPYVVSEWGGWVQFAERVGDGSGNCGTNHNWQCQYLTYVGGHTDPVIAVRGYGASLEVHVAFKGTSLNGLTRIAYIKRIGAGAFSPIAYYNTTGYYANCALGERNAIALDSTGQAFVTTRGHCTGPVGEVGDKFVAGWVSTTGGTLDVYNGTHNVQATAVAMDPDFGPVIAYVGINYYDVGGTNNVFVNHDASPGSENWSRVYQSDTMNTVSVALELWNPAGHLANLAFSDGSTLVSARQATFGPGYITTVHSAAGNASQPAIIVDSNDGVFISYKKNISSSLYIAND